MLLLSPTRVTSINHRRYNYLVLLRSIAVHRRCRDMGMISASPGGRNSKVDLWCFLALRWRHNERHGVSNHHQLICVCWTVFPGAWKKTAKPRVTGHCEGNPPVTCGFPSQKTINVENVSIWRLHHGLRALTNNQVSMTITWHHRNGSRGISRLLRTSRDDYNKYWYSEVGTIMFSPIFILFLLRLSLLALMVLLGLLWWY